MPLYFKAACIVAIGGFLFGLDTGTIGPVTTMSTYTATFGTLSSSKHGIIVSSILVGGSFSGLFAGNIADIYGRTFIIIIGGIIFSIGATMEAASYHLPLFVCGRVIAGIGEGLFLGTLVVYICEIAPARRRGPLASVVQFCTTVGIATGYFISYGTARIKGSSISWRAPLAFQALVAFCFAAACLAIPPSPRWLIAKGRKEEALATLERLGLASSELEEMIDPSSSQEAAASIANTSLLYSIRQHFKEMTQVFSKDARKQTGLACFLMAMQQLSGIDGVLYYAPLLFQQAGLASEEASFLASGVSALVMMAITVPASIYCDHWGRRASIIIGGCMIAGCMLLIGGLYASGAVHGDSGAARWVVIVTIYLFGIAFCGTWAVGIRIYSSEIQPARTRAGAASLAQSANWVANWLVAFTTPILLARSSFAIYFLFGSTSLITVIICAIAMPETKGKSLESIERTFMEKSSRSSLSGLRRRIINRREESGVQLDYMPRTAALMM